MNRTARIGLSPRLQMVADMVRRGAAVADIGTDHAYVPVYLLQNKISPGAIAADLREQPLAAAAATVGACGLESKISLRISDGLDHIKPGEAQDIIFAGMGGTLIAELLGRAVWLKDSAKQLILQPMTHTEDVRRFLCENGFKILFENACFEGRKCYVALCARYEPRHVQNDEAAYFYTGELPACPNDAAAEYLKRQRQRLKKRADALEKAGKNPEEVLKLMEIIKEISEVLHD